MPRIEILPSEVAEKIAAGEVIERPVSLVKEFVENSIDAGARSITIDVEKGGKGLVRVADDGAGMSREDIELAFSRHATSKIRVIDDLFNVRTMGFRGEALASIAAVARVTAGTRSAQDQSGWEVSIEPPAAAEIRPVGRAPGTTIEARDLFFNIPARKKFLKRDQTELGHITRYLQAAALGFPGMSLSLSSNGRKVFSAPAVESLRRRAATFYGEDIAEDLVEAQGGREGLKVHALIAPPFYSRVNRYSQYIYVNNRYVRDRLLQAAVSQAFRGLIEPNRFPIIFLYVNISPAEVDVNVHPTKMEIRFRNANSVRGTVISVLSEALLSADFKSRITFEEGSTPRAQNIRRSIEDFYERRVAGGVEIGTPATHAGRSGGSGSLTRDGTDTEAAAAHVQTGPLMQVRGTYIVKESDDGIEIIDQHALHERVIYAEVRRRLEEGSLQGQRLLVPEVIEVTPAERTALEKARDAFGRLGIEAEAFGQDAFAFHSFPAVLGDMDRRSLLQALISDLSAGGHGRSMEEALDSLAELLACHAAVRAGDILGTEELQSLMEKARSAQGRFACPHGRPTKLVLTFDELERRFRRK